MAATARSQRPQDPAAAVEWSKEQARIEAEERAERLGLGKQEVQRPIDYGTPETRAKNRTDIIKKLRANGSLNSAQSEAAREIAAVFESRNRGWGSKSSLEGGRVNSSPANFDPSELPADIEAAFHLRYMPWLREVGSDFITGKYNRISIVALVYEIIIGNQGPSQLDRRWRFANGTATRELQQALSRYALIAGWAVD